MSYLDSYVNQYMQSSSYILNPAIINELEKGLEITNIFFEFLLEQWGGYFVEIVANLKTNINIICSCLIVFQVIIYVWLI